MKDDISVSNKDNESTEVDSENSVVSIDIQAKVRAAISAAVDYVDTDLSGSRKEATDYYMGKPLGNEQSGRSQVVMTEVRDTVLSMMPSLLRVFAGSSDVCVFIPEDEDSQEEAEEKTEYVKHIFLKKNKGFKILYNAFKDALIRKHGVITWWWDVSYTVVRENYEGLTHDQYMMMKNDDEVTIIKESSYQDEVDVEYDEDQEETLLSQGSPINENMSITTTLWDITISRKSSEGRVRVEAIAAEEFLISRDARDEDTADVIGRRSKRTLSELISLGIDEEILEEVVGSGSSTVIDTTLEAQARSPNSSSNFSSDTTDESMERILYTDALIRMDSDGDGIAELHRICTVGDNYKVVSDDIVTDVNYAIFCPDPEPHTAIGSSVADQTMDLQEIKTSLMRSLLDSTAASIYPRTTIVENQVNVDDALNTELGAVIRQKQPGQVATLEIPYTGDKSMAVMQYIDRIKSSRTGMTEASQGLNPDALQSTHPDAIHNTQTAAEQRLEMVARIFAEDALPRVFMGIFKLVKQYGDQPIILRTDGTFKTYDPRTWSSFCEIDTEVAVGQAVQRKISVLTAVAAKQEEILVKMGMKNPLVTMKQYRNTLGDILKLNQVRNVSRYFKTINENDASTEQAPATPPSPEMVAAQAQAATSAAEQEMNKRKINKDISIANNQFILDQQKTILMDDRERDKQEADILLRAAELELKYGKPINIDIIMGMINRNRGNLPSIPNIPPADSPTDAYNIVPGSPPTNINSAPQGAIQ